MKRTVLAEKQAEFADQHFDEVDARGLKLQGCVFEQCSFTRCVLAEADLSNSRFFDCTFAETDLSNMQIRGATFRECIAKEADFADSNLSEVDLRGTDLVGARFANTNLIKVDLRHAINYSIRPMENKISKARFSLPEATLLLHGLGILLEE